MEDASVVRPPSRTVLIVGATSSLAQAICHTLAQQDCALVLSGRDEAELQLLASDLLARFQTVCTIVAADLLDPQFSPTAFVRQAGSFDDAIIATGDMGGDPFDGANLAYVTAINYILPARIAIAIARQLAEKKKGTLAIISSVAGDRGRQSNAAYGAAKAALSTFASGLRNRFAGQGVHVLTVKPGFIDTPMTWGMKSPLIASREYVAEKIVRAMQKKKDVVYVPWFWRLIMLIIIHIPERIFKRLSL